MRYRGKLFWISLVTSFTVLSLLVTGLLAGGVAAAVPIAGVGGFMVEADKIVATDFKLLPKMGPTSEKKMTPQAAMQMDAEIYGMKLYKDFDIPGYGKVRVLVTCSGVAKSTGMVMDASKVEGNHSFKKFTTKENYSQDVQKKFEMSANSLVLTNAKLRGHYLFNNTISLPGMKLEFQKLN
ncbi:hypothetical protein SAMN05444487_10698 [Marininema mesophilum]|uniref:Uncharacterized protein n=1 Tax=Marininema mesophilum TaxID=1048340 RepID=A0A1H2WDG0_9BACL|nr:DUF6230 family protein [Marininema mesophilum]SDW78723.1 hypothetical protein SAMN05444487_10698 [Marininema mesophilum]